MGFDFLRFIPFKKKTLEARAASSKVQLVVSRSASDADKHAPHCVREYTRGKNHSFSTKKEAISYIFRSYGNNFEIKEFERYHIQSDIDEYHRLINAERQNLAKK